MSTGKTTLTKEKNKKEGNKMAASILFASACVTFGCSVIKMFL